MSKNILIGTYVFTVQSTDGKDNIFYPLNDLVKSQDFFDIFKDFCEKTKYNTFKTKNKRLQTSTFKINETEKEIYGIFRGGAIGENFDVEDEQTDTFIINVEDKHCVFRDFFFYFTISLNKREGFLLVQKVGRTTIHNLIKRAAQKFVQDKKDKKKKLVLSKRLPSITLKQLFAKGELKSVNFIKKSIPTSLTDVIDKKQNTTYEKGTFTVMLKSGEKKGFGSNMKSQILEKCLGKAPNKAVIDIEELGGEYDEMTCTIKLHNGKRVKLYLVDPTKQSAYIDVTDDIKTDENDKPKFSSLVDESRKIVDEIMESCL